jgi:hypothetical protein
VASWLVSELQLRQERRLLRRLAQPTWQELSQLSWLASLQLVWWSADLPPLPQLVVQLGGKPHDVVASQLILMQLDRWCFLESDRS